MWVRRSAIRPISPYARVSTRAVEQVAARIFSQNNWAAQGELRLKNAQGALREYQLRSVAASKEIATLARQLRVGVFLFFEAAHPGAMQTVSLNMLSACEGALKADEQLRISDATDPMDTDDIVAMEQPEVMSWLNGQVSQALSAQAETIDVDEVGAVFRSLLVSVLALSDAVQAPPGIPSARSGNPLG